MIILLVDYMQAVGSYKDIQSKVPFYVYIFITNNTNSFFTFSEVLYEMICR